MIGTYFTMACIVNSWIFELLLYGLQDKCFALLHIKSMVCVQRSTLKKE